MLSEWYIPLEFLNIKDSESLCPATLNINRLKQLPPSDLCLVLNISGYSRYYQYTYLDPAYQYCDSIFVY